ncbi:MAG: hypothetical protein QOH72_4038 [Solirubrobacteraceae bacterium]|jgi:phospholipase C|nr:hypothetical protein [Solirubrobacteraceae bacterium]
MIDSRWGLPPLTVRDRTANDLGAELAPRANLAAPSYVVPPGPFGAPCGTPAAATEEEWGPVLDLARATGWPV